MIDLKTIGIIHSPYQEKFGVPRQPNLVPSGKGELHLLPPFNNPDCVRGLEQFSHLWLLFIFNHTAAHGWQNLVRPPRLGGNEKIGIFASRSTFRPNPIGLSAVELHDIVYDKGLIILKLGSVDIVDQTPVIDIKPYIPYSDCYTDALAGYASQKPGIELTVEFMESAEQQLKLMPELKELIIQVVKQDPRPAYKRNSHQKQEFGITLNHSNIRFYVENNVATIFNIHYM
ncbi:tRNA (N6-threonylcarbamoyladenosine(37)-N6)-methyltransferase TrmO [Orbus sturtevantii]|uniref:tRNA (N6-threonylcarbamoyladenosine(37)-N6)-methyltransferase TrmO n=1 Tax=Orbus sturtevantii TaxID=3074109 RepID=UPI00370D1488